MKIEQVESVVRGIKYMKLSYARVMTSLILESKAERILELGTFHGVSTCYIAAALDELGRGHVDTLDRHSAAKLDPNANQLLERLGLQRYVTTHYTAEGFTWSMMDMLEDGEGPRYDLAYIDGGHTWDVSGFAFFLVDRLLKPGGLVIFDDLHWKAVRPDGSTSPKAARMTQRERETAGVQKIWDLLVKPHPDYVDFREHGDWGIARKRATPRVDRDLSSEPMPVSSTQAS